MKDRLADITTQSIYTYGPKTYYWLYFIIRSILNKDISEKGIDFWFLWVCAFVKHPTLQIDAITSWDRGANHWVMYAGLARLIMKQTTMVWAHSFFEVCLQLELVSYLEDAGVPDESSSHHRIRYLRCSQSACRL